MTFSSLCESFLVWLSSFYMANPLRQPGEGDLQLKICPGGGELHV